MAIMPASSSDAVSRADLAEVVKEYQTDPSLQVFIVPEIMPLFETEEEAAGYPYIPREAVLKLAETLRNSDGSYNRVVWDFERKSYRCEEHGLEGPVSDRDAALYADYFDAESETAEIVWFRVMLHQEKRGLDMIQDTSTFTEQTVVTAWTTVATAGPALDVLGHKATMRGNGIDPNAIVLSNKVYRNLLVTTDVRNVIADTVGKMPREITKGMLARYFDVDYLYVADAIYDAADEGQSGTITEMMADEYAFLFRKAVQPKRLRECCLGRTMLWTGDSPTNPVVESYRHEPIRSDVVRVRHNVDEVFVCEDAGLLIDTEQAA